MIIERKGRGKELDKLFRTAIKYIRDDEELHLYKMIEKHPDPLNWTMDEYRGVGLLHTACEMNKVSILDTLLLPLHVNESVKGHNGRTPLMIACAGGHTDCVSVLLGPLIRTNVNAVADDGLTALHAASEFKSASCIPLLIDGGADVNAVNNKGFTALHVASQFNSASCIPLLIDGGIDMNAVDDNGFTALHTASYCNSLESVPSLIASGADMAMVSRSGKTALDVAKEQGHTAIVDLLTK